MASLDRAVVVEGRDQPERSGAVEVDLIRQVLNRLGWFGNCDGQFGLAYDVAIGRGGSIFVVDA